MGKLLKNSAIYAVGDIAPKLFNLITFPVLTSFLAVEDFGIINYINSVEIFLTILTFLGLKTYYLVFYYKQDSEKKKRELLGNLTLFILFVNVVFTFSMLLVGNYLFKAIGSTVEFFPYIAIGLVTNFFSILSVLPSALYRVKENPGPLTLINLIKGGVIMLLTCALISKFPNAQFVLYVKLVVSVIFGIFFLWITSKNAIFRLNILQLKSALIFSLPLVPGSIAYYFSTMFDRILLDKYLTTTAVGLYSTAATLAAVLNIVAYGSYKAFEPHFFKNYGTPSFVSGFTVIRNSLIWVILSFGMCICLFSKEFLLLFSSNNYHTAYLYVPLLVTGVFANSLQMMYSTVLTAQSKTKLNGMISIFCAVFSLVFNVIFIPRIGIWAAAISNLLIYVLGWLISRWCSAINIGITKEAFSASLYVVIVVSFVYVIELESIYYRIILKVMASIIFMLLSYRLLNVSIISQIVSSIKTKRKLQAINS